MHADIKLVLDNNDVPELHTKRVAKAIEVAPKLAKKAKWQPPPRADPTPPDPPSGPPPLAQASPTTLIPLMILMVIPGPMRIRRPILLILLPRAVMAVRLLYSHCLIAA